MTKTRDGVHHPYRCDSSLALARGLGPACRGSGCSPRTARPAQNPAASQCVRQARAVRYLPQIIMHLHPYHEQTHVSPVEHERVLAAPHHAQRLGCGRRLEWVQHLPADAHIYDSVTVQYLHECGYGRHHTRRRSLVVYTVSSPSAVKQPRNLRFKHRMIAWSRPVARLTPQRVGGVLPAIGRDGHLGDGRGQRVLQVVVLHAQLID